PQEGDDAKPRRAGRRAPPWAGRAWAAARPWGAAPPPPEGGPEPLGRIDSQRPIAHRPPRWLPPQRPAGRIAFPLLHGIPPPRPGIMPETMASVRQSLGAGVLAVTGYAPEPRQPGNVAFLSERARRGR